MYMYQELGKEGVLGIDNWNHNMYMYHRTGQGGCTGDRYLKPQHVHVS
jgi:hypothetical protein